MTDVENSTHPDKQNHISEQNINATKHDKEKNNPSNKIGKWRQRGRRKYMTTKKLIFIISNQYYGS